MVTIHQERGFRFWINTDDHAPAHVLVRRDGECRINIRNAEGRPELMSNKGMRIADARHALRIVTRRQAEFLDRWRAIHG